MTGVVEEGGGNNARIRGIIEDGIAMARSGGAMEPV